MSSEQLRGLSTRSVARGPGGKPISWGTLPILISLVFPFHYSHKCSPDFHSDFIVTTVGFYPKQTNAISWNKKAVYHRIRYDIRYNIKREDLVWVWKMTSWINNPVLIAHWQVTSDAVGGIGSLGLPPDKMSQDVVMDTPGLKYLVSEQFVMLKFHLWKSAKWDPLWILFHYWSEPWRWKFRDYVS